MFQKFSKYNAQMFEAQVYSFRSCKDKVLFQKKKSTRESVTITELQITPD